MVFLAFAESIQLVPDGTLFLHIAIIIAMVFILNKTLFKPINRVLAGRDQRTRGSSNEAQGILRRVDESLTRYERSLRDARTESYRLLEEQRTEAVNARQLRLNSVREEMESIIEVEKQSLQTQATEARADLDAEARRIAVTIRDNILGRKTG